MLRTDYKARKVREGSVGNYCSHRGDRERPSSSEILHMEVTTHCKQGQDMKEAGQI